MTSAVKNKAPKMSKKYASEAGFGIPQKRLQNTKITKQREDKMKLIEEPLALLEETTGPVGLAVGIGALLLAPVLIPVVAGVGKPLVKGVIKGSISLAEKTKGMLAEVGESVEDIVAEAKAEMAENQMQKTATGNSSEA